MRSRAYSKCANRLRDVLELLFAPILEANIQLALDLAVHFFGNQDAAWIGKSFQPDRDVDSIPEEVAIVADDYVAKVDPDAQLEATTARGETVLYLRCASDGSQRAGKLRRARAGVPCHLCRRTSGSRRLAQVEWKYVSIRPKIAIKREQPADAEVLSPDPGQRD